MAIPNAFQRGHDDGVRMNKRHCRRCGYHRSTHTYGTTVNENVVLLCPIIGPSLEFQRPEKFERIPHPIHAPEYRTGRETDLFSILVAYGEDKIECPECGNTALEDNGQRTLSRLSFSCTKCGLAFDAEDIVMEPR